MAKHLKCYYINHGLNFFLNDVKICCKELHNSSSGMPLISGIKDFSVEKMIEKKKLLREMLYNNVVPDCCKNCPYIKEYDDEKEPFDSDLSVGLIDINSSVNCNSRCIYCNRPELMRTFKENSIYGILKKLKKNNLLKQINSGYVQYAGGEPTIMKDFDKIVNFFAKETEISDFTVHTNGIIYSKKLEFLLNKKNTKIVISLDAGTKELFNRIRQVNCYEKVIKNISNYIKANKNPKSSVRVKYIIIPELNDNKEEIMKWYNLCLSMGVKVLILDVEASWYQENRCIPEHIENLIKLIQENSKKDNIALDYYESLRNWNPDFVKIV